MTESDLKRAAKQWLASVGAWTVLVPRGAYGRPGDPDLTAVWHGLAFALEAKNPDGRGRQSGWQEQAEAACFRAGGDYILFKDVPTLRRRMEYRLKRRDEGMGTVEEDVNDARRQGDWHGIADIDAYRFVAVGIRDPSLIRMYVEQGIDCQVAADLELEKLINAPALDPLS